MILFSFLVDPVKYKMNPHLILHGEGACEIEGKTHFTFVGQFHGGCAILHVAAIRICPRNVQLSCAGGLQAGSKNNGYKPITLEGRRGQYQLSGWGTGR
jgi:hypothetical protein